MKITLFPSMAAKPMEATINGDVITINGVKVDLSVVPEGYTLPGYAVGNEFFVAQIPVTRVNGELSFGLIMQVFPRTDEKWRDPLEPNVLVVKSGKVPFPDVSEPVDELPELDLPPVDNSEPEYDRPEPVGENQDA